MAYTTKTTTSYGSRISSSFKGIVTGFILFIGATVLLWWNEGRTVKTQDGINEAQEVTVSVNDVSVIDPNLNGKLIHASAMAETQDTLTDSDFGVKENAIKLSRDVEYYQFVQYEKSTEREKIGGGKETTITYTYQAEWSDKPINSQSFADPAYRNSNSILVNIPKNDEIAENVTFGAYSLPKFLIESISGYTPVNIELSDEDIKRLESYMGHTPITTATVATGDTIKDSARVVVPTTKLVHTQNNTVYLGASPGAPTIGDVRVTINKVKPAQISLIAQVINKTFEPYNCKNGYNFSRLDMGQVSASTMFNSAHAENNLVKWILRVLGIVLIIAGLKSMFSILPTLFAVLPFLGNIVGAGIGLVCFIVGLAWSLIVIGLAWLFFRPLIGIAMLAIAIGLIYWLRKRAKEKNLQKQMIEEPVKEKTDTAV